MRRERHLVILVKAPRMGAVKTRLAAGIGEAAAWRFYRNVSARILRRLARDPRWRCRLAVTPDGCARWRRHWPPDIPRMAQGGGGLGARMARPMHDLPPGPVVIVGSDIPGLDAGHVARAFRLLERHAAVFGPAEDGGYWLVGLGRRGLARRLFDGVRWSTRHALADTLANLPPGTVPGLLGTLADVDDAKAYGRWLRGVSAR
jgi:hypothetical protein